MQDFRVHLGFALVVFGWFRPPRGGWDRDEAVLPLTLDDSLLRVPNIRRRSALLRVFDRETQGK